VRDSARFGAENGWLSIALWVAIVLGALLLGYWMGYRATVAENNSASGPAAES
jgi:hypothetical protein